MGGGIVRRQKMGAADFGGNMGGRKWGPENGRGGFWRKRAPSILGL